MKFFFWSHISCYDAIIRLWKSSLSSGSNRSPSSKPGGPTGEYEKRSRVYLTDMQPYAHCAQLRSGRFVSLFLGQLSFLLCWGSGSKLKSMNASLLCHLVFQQRIDHAMPSWLQLRLEFLGCYNNPEEVLASCPAVPILDAPEMSLRRSGICHCLVMRMQMRVIVDLESRRFQCFRDLRPISQCKRIYAKRADLRSHYIFHRRCRSHRGQRPPCHA